MAYVKDEAALELGVRFMRAIKLHPSDLLHDKYIGDYTDYSPAQYGQTMTFNRDDLENILKMIKYYIDKATVYDRGNLQWLYEQKFQDDQDLKMVPELRKQWAKEQGLNA